MNISREKYNRAALLLTEFLDDLLNQTPNILESQKDMHLNLEKIKEKSFEDLQKEDKVALVLVLLKQLQPYLSANNLSTAPPLNHQPRAAPLSPTNAMPLSPNQKNEFVRQQTDEILRANGALGTSNEVEALNGILDNINVKTKNQNWMTGNPVRKLPPINQM